MAKQNVLTRSKKQKAEKALKAGKFAEAEKFLTKVCSMDPGDVGAWLQLGSVYGSRKNFNGVAQCAEKVLAIDSENPIALGYMGNLYTMYGQNEKAIENYTKSLAKAPKNANTLTNLAVLYLTSGDRVKAVDAWEKVVEITPKHIEALQNLASTYMDMGRVLEATKHYMTLLELQPDDLETHRGYAQACLRHGNHQQAIAHFHECLRLTENHLPIYCSLADVSRVKGDLDKAAEYYAKARCIDATDELMLVGEAGVFYHQGETDKAYERINQLINDGCKSINLVNVFSQFCHHYNRTDDVVNMGESILKAKNLAGHHKVTLHFNLGRVLDKAKKYDEAFSHFDKGNQLIGEAFDRDRHSLFMQSLRTQYSQSFIEQMPRSNCDSQKPVFIIGMPRSGTSLVEQILSSHPEVCGAGELPDINALAYQFIPTNFNIKESYPNYAAALEPSQLNLCAERYLNKLASFSKNAKYVTDKMPHNVRHLGLISQLFPKARIIHCKRDPMDTALSIYFQNFHNAHGYAFDLANIAHVYNEYERTMQHWKQTLDIPIIEITYQQMVDDFETTVRNMISFLDLDWNDNCLEFYKSKRTVATASYDQVRSPIYSSSVNRWKNYEKYLQPLKQGLDSSL